MLEASPHALLPLCPFSAKAGRRATRKGRSDDRPCRTRRTPILASGASPRAGSDILFGGAGNDILFYDPNDVFIDGGAGIDLLLAGDAVANTLDSLLANTSTENGPIVNNVEALVTGSAIGKLTDAASLESYGITFTDANQDGNAEAVELTAFDASTSTGLMQADNGSFEHITNNSVDLTMDIASMPEDQNSAELQAIMFQLSTTPS